LTTSSDANRFGPTLLPDGVHFSVWAPGAARVELVLHASDETRHLMTPEVGGFFALTVPGVGPGARYRLSRDGGPALPDPASHFQPEGVHGPSEVVDLALPSTTPGWRGLPPRELVIYELHVGTFSPEGTYAGVQARLPHLQRLGVTAIELMPLAAFPGRHNWGYDGVFHFAPFAGYGTPAQLTALVQACHRAGIAVILDLVTNHFGPQGNAMWSLAPAFFRPDRPSAWSAGHDWAAEPVLRYFDEVARFWIHAYQLDGLRLDAFHAVPGAARGTHLSRMVRAIDHGLEPGRQVLVLLESVDNQVSLMDCATPRVSVAQLNFDVQRAGHALLTGERHAEYADFAHPEQELGLCLERGFAFAGRHSQHHRRVRGEARGLTSWDQVVGFLQNHDTCGNRHLGQRLDTLLDDALGGHRLRAATALLLLHPHIPFLFMGQEWGSRGPFHFFTDFPEALGQATQRGRMALFHEPRAPDADAPGCQDPEAFLRSHLPWDELSNPEAQAHLELVRQLLALRRRLLPHISRRADDVRLRRDGQQFTLELLDETRATAALLLCNLDPARPMPLPDEAAGMELLLGTRELTEGGVPPACTVVLARGG